MRAFILLLALVLGACAGAQSSGSSTAGFDDAMPQVDSARLIGDLYRLAHDSMRGRASMTPENAKARAFLVGELRRLGVEPVNGSYEHGFSMPRRGRADSVKGVNVLGQIRGRVTPGRAIVVSAHYDHVGERNGQIYNGSDDNASGTAALLQIAAHFRASPPQHTVVFAFFDAEEMGLLGARAFVANPPLPLPSIGANVNMDMVSRSQTNELWAAGGTPYPQLKTILESYQPSARLRLRLGHDSGGGRDDWTSQSDQGAFHAAGIPFVYFGVEDHPDYHAPTDDPEKVDAAFYVRAAQTIAGFVVRLDRALPER